MLFKSSSFLVQSFIQALIISHTNDFRIFLTSLPYHQSPSLSSSLYIIARANFLKTYLIIPVLKTPWAHPIIIHNPGPASKTVAWQQYEIWDTLCFVQHYTPAPSTVIGMSYNACAILG